MSKGIHFVQDSSGQGSDPRRMDIVCFIGFVQKRPGAMPDQLREHLQVAGWLARPGYSAAIHARASAESLIDVPVLVENWEAFDRLFAWEQRSVNADLHAACYLGAAVRAFFASGGRRCYVISCGAPSAYNASLSQRQALLQALLPDYPARLASKPSNRDTWHGLGHLYGLAEVSFVCLPDLCDLFRDDAAALDTDPGFSASFPEQFVECSQSQPASPPNGALETIPAPRLSHSQLLAWAESVRFIARFLATECRSVQLLASLPLPKENSPAYRDYLRTLYRENFLQADIDSNNSSLASAFIQLVYPWLQTRFSQQLPQGIEPGEGALAGALADNALRRGCYRTIAGRQHPYVQSVFPVMAKTQYALEKTHLNAAGAKDTWAERVSFWQSTPEGVALYSDVTSSSQSSYRPASVDRTLNLIVRTARDMGEAFIFDSNGEDLWRRVRTRMEKQLETLFFLGALSGKSSEEAYRVRCDRSTMTQQDIDSGRIKAAISVNIAASIESINISFVLPQSGAERLDALGLREVAS